MTRLLTVLLLLSGLLAGSPVAAQQPGLPAPATAEDTAGGAESAAPLDDLIRVLRDETAREALIAELERAATATDGGAAAGEQVAEAPPASLGARIASVTQTAAENATFAISQVWTSLRGARVLLRGLEADTWRAVWDGVLDILLVIVVTFAVFFSLRAMTFPLLRRLGRSAQSGGVARILIGFAGSLVLRVAVVAIAWSIGYGAMTIVFGDFGQIRLNQTLFLNAFLAVELTKAAIRTVLSPAADDLRALPMSDRGARTASRVASIAIGILGYGIMLFVPLVQEAGSFLARRSVSVLVIELTVLYLAVATVWHRKSVGDWLVANLLARPAPAEDEDGEAGTATKPGARTSFFASVLVNWHWFALIYLGFIVVRSLTHSLAALGGIVVDTLQIAAVAFVGTALIGFLGRRMQAGTIVPDNFKEKLPFFEKRFNKVVLMALRALVAIIVVFFALDKIGLFAFADWINEEGGQRFSGALIAVSLILFVAWAIWLAVSSWIDYRLNPDIGDAPSSREITLLTLLKNAATVAILIFAVMFSLSEIGLNIGPLLASAGVFGLAIGFGAQKFVQDIITGIFIQFENAINVGDVVTVGGTSGAVERLTVRSVTLRDLQGIVHIIPFSSVDMVSNFTREFSFYVLDMGIAYREDVDEARQAMFDAYDELRDDPDQGIFLLGDLEYFGLDAFGDSSVVVKVRIKTWPGKQWGVGRAYNRLVKKIFDERGIEIPFPHTTLVFGESKGGTTQPIRIAPAAGDIEEPLHGEPVAPGRGQPTDDGE